MKTPLVSVVIPTYNRREMLHRLIKSIFLCTYKNLEVIVIDDASSDNTDVFIKNKFKGNRKIKVYRNKKNLFAAESRNVGFRKSAGKFIFFIDDDNVVDKSMIEEMVKVFLSNKSIGELGPVNYSYSNKSKVLWACTKRDMLTSKTHQSRSLKEFGMLDFWETDDVLNAYMIRKDIMEKSNIRFKKLYGIMYEESDVAYRIRRLGYKVMVVRKAKIFHDIDVDSTKETKRDYLYHFMNDARRPFVFARNRIIFHSFFSSNFQFLCIIFFWSWLFTFYYIHKFLFYSGYGNFSMKQKIYISYQYFKGQVVGISGVFGKKLYE